MRFKVNAIMADAADSRIALALNAIRAEACTFDGMPGVT